MKIQPHIFEQTFDGTALVLKSSMATSRVGRRDLLVSFMALLACRISSAEARGEGVWLADGISASIESLRLTQEAVRARGQLRAEVTLRNRSLAQKSGFVLAECRNASGAIVEQSRVQMLLEPKEVVTLWFTADVGDVKGVGFFEVKTGLASSEAPFEVL
jgi:hypothetical protein